mmetsp:Transcript_7861/g.17124  ORF Transcript_7861/g.17124 Transcript_7861/m.17124 type:complete len:185 (-) Transcript_7861:99-653(-)
MLPPIAGRQLCRFLAFTCCHTRVTVGSFRSFHIRNSCQRSGFSGSAAPGSTSTVPPYMYHRLYSGTNADPEYHARAEKWGLASKEEVAKSALKEDTIWLDVRSPPEIEAEPSKARERHVYCQCTMDDTSKLAEQAHELFPDKNATIVVYCAVGGRASVAKECLESMGYKNVLNAGGLKDLNDIE